jgi:hypothetical protein
MTVKGAEPPRDHGGDMSALGPRSESGYAGLGPFSPGGYAIHGRQMPGLWTLDLLAQRRYGALGEKSRTK